MRRLIDPSNSQECWIRHLLEGGAIRNNPPRIRVGYLHNQLKPVSGFPWQAAMSGRLLSLAFDWQLAAEREVSLIGRPGLQFRGVAHMDINAPLAAGPPNFGFEYQPRISDCAHANLIVWRAPLAPVDTPDGPRRISQDVLRALAALLNLAESDPELQALEAHRVTIDRTTPLSRKIRSAVNQTAFKYRFAKRRINRLWRRWLASAPRGAAGR